MSRELRPASDGWCRGAYRRHGHRDDQTELQSDRSRADSAYCDRQARAGHTRLSDVRRPCSYRQLELPRPLS